MKRFLLVLSLWLCGSVVFANDVLEKAAQTVAKNFYNQTTGSSLTDQEVKIAYTFTTPNGVGRSSDGKNIYYVFNIRTNGFVVVSGEDFTQPVLAYGTEKNFDAKTANKSVKKWMDNYALQITYVKESVHSASSEVLESWNNYLYNIPTNKVSRSTSAVSPLCATHWDQAPNYNALCPYDNSAGDYCVTGCVATAMAQILKFWNYPAQGTGNHSYNDQNFGTLSANFGNTTYNWSGMPNSVSGSNNAVATLMYHCGVAVEMNYSTTSSGAYVASAASPVPACAEVAYKTYFGYDPSTVSGKLRSAYSEAQWIALLKADLDAGRPIQYAGIGGGGGHTWVCDGYDANSFFHMNWGWSGNSDGYFSVNNLAPAALGTGGGSGGFVNDQHAVFGIKPLNGTNTGGTTGGTVNPPIIKLYSAISVNANPIQAQSSLVVTADIANYSSGAFAGDFAAALFTSDGVFVNYIQQYPGENLPGSTYNTYTFTLNPLDVIPGVYSIGLYYKTGSNNYTLIDKGTYVNPVNITVTGPANNIQMASTATTNPAPAIQTNAFSSTASFKNTGSAFSGWVSADVFDASGNYIHTIEEKAGVSMANGSQQTFTFSTSSITDTPGTFYLAYFSSPDHTNWTLIYGSTYANPIKFIEVAKPVTADQWEVDNTAATAANLPVNFVGNAAHVNTDGATLHTTNDFDYYKINLPAGTNYAVTARVFDLYAPNNPKFYTVDALFSYSLNGGSFSTTYDDVMPNPIIVYGGGTLIFYVAPYFQGNLGTYSLDLQILQGDNVGIEEATASSLKIYPNPAQNSFTLDKAVKGAYQLQVVDLIGNLVYETEASNSTQSLVTVNTKNLTNGMYLVKLVQGNQQFVSKLTIQK